MYQQHRNGNNFFFRYFFVVWTRAPLLPKCNVCGIFKFLNVFCQWCMCVVHCCHTILNTLELFHSPFRLRAYLPIGISGCAHFTLLYIKKKKEREKLRSLFVFAVDCNWRVHHISTNVFGLLGDEATSMIYYEYVVIFEIDKKVSENSMENNKIVCMRMAIALHWIYMYRWIKHTVVKFIMCNWVYGIDRLYAYVWQLNTWLFMIHI